eukprot:TRINITY_DN6281_c0_g1_i12.p1 TRINITY_DN6281_c0_g1~~TRINITY_DN6281_c0_g1_i12.p1  ORF type:complete len:120 (+),score=18.64 TRINITY_DN6281_c0_g1_i12:207-566(+)
MLAAIQKGVKLKSIKKEPEPQPEPREDDDEPVSPIRNIPSRAEPKSGGFLKTPTRKDSDDDFRGGRGRDDDRDYDNRGGSRSRRSSRSEERFSRNAETDLVCRLLLEKKKKRSHIPSTE